MFELPAEANALQVELSSKRVQSRPILNKRQTQTHKKPASFPTQQSDAAMLRIT